MFIHLCYIPANADYSVATESAAYRDFRTRLLVDAEIFLRADRVGLEDNETFSLILEAEAGSPAEQFLTMAQTDTFVNLMIEITIVDVDGKPITNSLFRPHYTRSRSAMCFSRGWGILYVGLFW